MNIKNFFKWYFLILVILGVTYCQTRSVDDVASNQWMSRVLDSTNICEMNIPGTHNSGTKRTTVFTSTVASCQGDSITEQLEKGIRYLDIRIDSNLLVNHGGVSCYKSTFDKLYLEDVFNEISDFLAKNPTETVIVQLKQEGKADGDFDSKVDEQIWKRKNIYLPWKNPSALTLGDVRGQMVLFSRSGNIHKTYKFNRWADNCDCWQINIGNSSAILQDSYNDKNEKEKMEHIREFYKTVWEGYAFKGLFYINFTSCVGACCPKSVAKSINKSFKSFVAENRGKKFGVVLMDNPDSSLIYDIYSSNYEF